MSTTITVAFIKQFERDVHEAFQRKGSVALSSVRRKPNVIGSSTTFQKVGKGTATTKSRHGLITPMNVVHTKAEATMVDFYAGDWVDKLDEAKINIDERKVLANAGAFALGRKIDDQLFTAMDGTTTTGSSTAGLILSNVQLSFEQLHDLDVFEDGRMFCAIPANGWNDLLAINQFASSDFVNDKPFITKGVAKMWYGTTFYPTTAVLDFKSGSTFAGYWYHEDAVGYGNNAGISLDIEWSGERAAHFVNHSMSGGAVLIDTNGVLKLQWT